jgi:hypothetical protein
LPKSRTLLSLQLLALPPAPLHIGNSNDTLQCNLEAKHHDTLYLLSRLAEGEKHLFSTIRLLTRNPVIACEPDYLAALAALRDRIVIQVSLPILNRGAWQHYEPGVPAPEERMEAISNLRSAGVEVALRIDPLFPRDPLPREIFGKPSLSDFDIVSAQTEDDLRTLVGFAARERCHSIIYSSLKLPIGAYIMDGEFLRTYRALFSEACKCADARVTRNYMRLPQSYQKVLSAPILEEAQRSSIKVEHCMHNLVRTR